MYGDLRVRGRFNNPVRDIHTWGSTIINIDYNHIIGILDVCMEISG